MKTIFERDRTVTEQLEDLSIKKHMVKEQQFVFGGYQDTSIFCFSLGEHHHAAWVDKDDMLIYEFSCPNSQWWGWKVAHIGAEYIVGYVKGEQYFRNFTNKSMTGVSIDELIEKMKGDEKIMMASTAFCLFFSGNEPDLSFFPLNFPKPQYRIEGNYTIKGIPLYVTQTMIRGLCLQDIRVSYNLKPVLPHGVGIPKFNSELSVKVRVLDNNWESPKQFLKSHEDFIYHWLRDLDKEIRKTDEDDSLPMI